MDRRTLLAVVLCFLIFLGWQKLYIEPRLPHPVAQPSPIAQTGTAPVTTAVREARKEPQQPSVAGTTQKQVPFEQKPLETGTGTALIGNGGRVFTGWELKSYRTGISEQAAAVDLKAVTHQEGEVELAFDDPNFAYLANVRGTLASTPGGQTWTYEDDKVRLVREISGNTQQSFVDLRLSAQFKVTPPKFAFISVMSQGAEKDPEIRDRQLVYWAANDIHRVPLKESIELQDVPGPVRWVGVTNRYFVMTLVNETGALARGLVQPLGPWGGRLAMVMPVSSNSISVPLKAYFGPKELGLLRSVDATLDHTVDLGWFTVVAYPLLRLLKWFHAVAGNWGVAIILLTLLVKAVTFPLTYKSMKSMKKMAKIQPQMQRLREKHKDDREALNREMLTLMRTHGYNPMAGCLPILIQMPVFFALYRVLYSSIELYHAPFALWIQDLSAHDPFYVTPVLLTATMWLQQKLTPTTATDPAQQKMMQLMPVIFGVFMLSLPSGLTVYMLVNALTSIVQQLYLNKKLGLGNATPSPVSA